MAKSAPSLRDVAHAAGVSLGTASRALNNKGNVLPATRALVLKAAADLGYKLSIRVPTSVASKINTIGVVVKRDPGEHPSIDVFNYAILCGIEDECERLGLNMMYASLPVDEYSQAVTWSPLIENGDVDGLVIVGVVFNDTQVTDRIPEHVPVVLVDAYAPRFDCDTVIINNMRGACEAVEYLIEQGHVHIGLIGTNSSGHEHPGITERRHGYLNALARHNIAQTYIEDSLLVGAHAYDATLRLLTRAPHITALFSVNDEIAKDVIRAAVSLGRRIPEDLSIMGFDDSAAALRTDPKLTTVRVDKELMGALAVRQLYERAANNDRPPITTLIGTRLVERDSVQKVVNRQGEPV